MFRTHSARTTLTSAGILFAFLLGFGFARLTTVSEASAEANDAVEESYRALAVFSEALGHIENSYVDETGTSDLVYGAIEGMVELLDDHSLFLTPDELEALRDDTRGRYVGVGMEVGLEEEDVVIRQVFEGGPAFDAGLLGGDRILAIDGDSTEGYTIEDVVGSLRGLRGQSVTVDILRDEDELHFELVRDIIQLDTVEEELLSGGYGLIRLLQFNEDTTDEIRASLDRLEEENNGALEGLILDLRGNPGGLLREAIRLSDFFLNEGTIVSTAGRQQTRERQWSANRNATRYDGSLVVLIDATSASASEIVAGALQDNARARLVGRRSYGKGSVQSIIPLSDGSGIKLTVSRYYTPDGRSIHEAGITPDIEVLRDDEGAIRSLPREGDDATDVDEPTQRVLSSELPVFEESDDPDIIAALVALGRLTLPAAAPASTATHTEEAPASTP